MKTKNAHRKKVSAAGLVSKASVMSAAASEALARDVFDGFEVHELIDELENKITAINGGSLEELEKMLVGQSHALQTIFTCLVRRASIEKDPKKYQLFMNLALRAQSQSRSTVQTLIELKHPRQIAFVNQANIAHGHQQVNNVDKGASKEMEQESKKLNRQNELLEVDNGNKAMDFRAKAEAVEANFNLAPLESE